MKIKNVNKLKGSDIFVNENFCFETIEWRKELWQEVKRFRSEDPIAFLSHWLITVKRKKSTLPAKVESLSVGPFFVIDSLNHNSQDPDVSFSHGNVSLLETNYILRRDFNGNFHSLFNNIISEV